MNGLKENNKMSYKKKFKPIPNAGMYYKNELWMSEAYQSLAKSSMNLLQCLISEIRWYGDKKPKDRKRALVNDGEVSFTQIQFVKHFKLCKASYINARNQLIKVGLIEMVYRGGRCKGDMARYKVLCIPEAPKETQRWRRYPQENWSHKVPKLKSQLVGLNTRFPKGKNQRAPETTLSEYTLNSINHPIELDPYDS